MDLKLSLLILTCFGVVQSCKTAKTSVQDTLRDTEALYVFQGSEKHKVLQDHAEITLDRAAFSLRFSNKAYNPPAEEWYAAQVVAFLNKDGLSKLSTGVLTSETECFSPGTGMAPNRSGKYESLIFKDFAHHYLFYENSESKRLNLIHKSEEYMMLEFEIHGLYYNDKDEKMSTTALNEFYLAVFIDRNLNKKIEEGELKKLTIKLR